MGIVLRETRRLNGLITNFLAYARPGPVRRERVVVAELAQELLAMLEKARPENVALRCEVPKDLAVWGDASQLRQLLWNLCLNAVQAMAEGGVLSLEAARDPLEAAGSQSLPQETRARGRNEAEAEGAASVEIVVRDTGSGIAPDVLERIFDPFFTTRREGSGLGLATVHRIVEGHGGSLRVETTPGSGTAFRVRLPSAGEAA
jgi:two-component system sensor histidine kinase PilS (NtrC family)